MTRLVYVTPTPEGSPRGGRDLLSGLHLQALRDVAAPQNVRLHRLDGSSAGVRAALAGWLDGVTPASVAAVIDAADRHAADLIWLDGSNLGRLAQAVRRARPRLRVLTFCHNVEARFFLDALRQRPGARALGVLVGNAVAERLAVRCSDDVVTLSRRDSDGLTRLYGRGADALLPMAMAAQTVAAPAGATAPRDAPLLFVGGGFYANIAGIGWFARHVAPHIDLPVKVVGRGMEALRPVFAAVPNMVLVGAVDDLAEHYAEARAVIAPIFDGSGMKTKVAEALMHGKCVIGTAEAFSGYGDEARAAGAVCETAGAFIAAIAEARVASVPRFDPTLRRLYDRHHSLEATRVLLADILGRTSYRH